MSLIAIALKHMLAAGLPADAIVAAVEEMVSATPADDLTERRRAKDRERKRLRKSADSAESAESAETLSLSSEVPPTPPSYPSNPIQLPPIVPQKTARKAKPIYPEAFVVAWQAYPHVEGRSSQPNAATAWGRLSPEVQAALPSAIAKFRPKVATVCGDRGAPDMARWLRDGKHLNWIAAAEAEPPAAAWSGPAEILATILALPGGQRLSGYLSQCQWQEVPERAVIGGNGFVLDTLQKEAGPALAALGVKLLRLPPERRTA